VYVHRQASKKLLLVGSLLTLYFVWGSTFLAQRVALAAFAPLRMTGIRFFAAGALLYGIVRMRGERAPTPRALGAAAVVAVPLFLVGMGGAAVALERTPSGAVALVWGSVPLWTAILDGLWGNRLRRAEIAGLAFGLFGVGLVALRGSLRSDPGPAALLAAAALCYALGLALTRRWPLAAGGMAMATSMLIGGLMLLGASVLRGEAALMVTRPAIVALAYLVGPGSLLGWSALGWLLRNARTSLAMSYAYVNPVVALLLGAAFGGERFGAADVVALGLVLLAVGSVALAERSVPSSARERSQAA